MLSQTKRIALLTVTLVAGSLVLTQAAQADHQSFVFSGRSIGCSGEAHMIEALRLLDAAYMTPDLHQRTHLVSAAEAELRGAAREVAAGRTGHYLLFAGDYLNGFRYTRHLHDLDDAARMINRALHAEQEYFLSLRRHHHHDSYTAPIGYGSSFGRLRNPSRGFSIRGGVKGSHGSFYFGGSRGGFSVRF